MAKNILDIEEWLYFCLLISMSIMFLHQAWASLVQKKISKFSFDRIMLIFSENFSSQKDRLKTRKLIGDPQRILMSGLFALLAFIGFVTEAVKWLMKFY